MDSDVSDYDEDVIPPYSPLSEYINSYETFEDKVVDDSDQDYTEDTTQQSDNHPSINSKLLFCLLNILNACKLFLRCISDTFTPSLEPHLYYALKETILKSVNFMQVLVPEDLSMLLNFESDDEFTRYPKISNNVVIQPVVQFVGFIVMFWIIDSTTEIYTITFEDFSLYSLQFSFIAFKIFLWLIQKICNLISILVIVFMILIFWEVLFCLAVFYSIYQKLQATESIVGIFKKCLRLIQESELIARGFTSASIPGIVERLELSTSLPLISPQRQNPELRKHVFIWTKELFMVYRIATKNLLKDSKFDPMTDFAPQSLASLELEEFGELFKYNVDSDIEMEELLKCSDNFSVSSLKTMHLLAELQMSEFYKCLYLKLSFLISDYDALRLLSKISKFITLIFSLGSVLIQECCIEERARKVYKYYRSLEINSDVEHKIIVPGNTYLSPIEINVHNMSLHLRSALKRITDLEEVFDESQNLNHPKLLKKTENMFKEIKSEIDIYEDYYQKCSNALQNILYGKKELPVNKFLQEGISNETVKPSATLRCDMEPDIQDEIFEAVASQSSLENDNSCEDYSVDCHRNTEATSKLLHELKNVLVVKADEHRAREQIALAKKNNNENFLHRMSSTDSLSDILKDVGELKLKTSNKIGSPNLVMPDINIETPQSSSESDEENFSFDTDVYMKDISNTHSSFADSIAALAIQRQKLLGISNDAMFSDGTSSDDEEIH